MDGWAAVHGAAKSDRSERLTNLKCYFRSPFRLGKEMHTDKCNPPNMSALCAGHWVRCSAQGRLMRAQTASVDISLCWRTAHRSLEAVRTEPQQVCVDSVGTRGERHLS